MDKGGGSRGILLRASAVDASKRAGGEGAWLRPWIAGSILQTPSLASWCLGQVA